MCTRCAFRCARGVQKTAKTMEYDLLIIKFDEMAQLFIDGYINYNLFEEIENEYLKRKQLFTINLN